MKDPLQNTQPDFDLLNRLVEQVIHVRGGPYAGISYRDIQRYNSYEEPGSDFVMTQEDIFLTDLYAGLAVLASDAHAFLKSSPRPDDTVVEEVVAAVAADENRRPENGTTSN